MMQLLLLRARADSLVTEKPPTADTPRISHNHGAPCPKASFLGCFVA
jgi:hypothetical protein